MRGRSYSPSPPRGYSRRGRSPRGRSPKGRYGDRSRDAPTSLLVRNLRHDCRPEDLRRPFEKFGPVRDIYLPRDYYTGDPRGFGFVQYVDPADAAEAKYEMDARVFQGRQLTVVFAEENRKKPPQMKSRESSGRSRGYDRRWSPARSPARYSPPPKRRCSRSVSPQEKRHSSRSPSRDRSSSRSRSRSPPVRGRSPLPYKGSRSRSGSPVMRSPSPDPGRGHNRSWNAERVHSPQEREKDGSH